MKKAHLLKDLAAQLSELFPTHLDTLKKDFEKNCRSILSKAFEKFDLVTREDFDTQTRVLARTRKKLEELEKHIVTIENQLKKIACPKK